LGSIALGAAASMVYFSQCDGPAPDNPSSAQGTQRDLQVAKKSSSDDGAWLTKFVQDIWPRISAYLKKLFDDKIEPAINNALPAMMKGHVTFTKVTLGNESPDFGPLNVVEGPNGGIRLKIGMNLVSNIDIWLKAMGVSIGVSKLKLTCTLCINFKPPSDSPPFFGGL